MIACGFRAVPISRGHVQVVNASPSSSGIAGAAIAGIVAGILVAALVAACALSCSCIACVEQTSVASSCFQLWLFTCRDLTWQATYLGMCSRFCSTKCFLVC